MYACQTDYQRLYAPTYFGKSGAATSFAVDVFTRAVIDFCSTHALRHVVDVGSGSGVFATVLRDAGLHVITCDFDPVASDGIHLDLAGPVDDVELVLQSVRAETAGEPWLVTCLDVLEHIDIEDVATAVQNLHVLTVGQLLVSISTRPSSADNKYHATILPKGTWLEILRIAGYDIEVESIFEHTRTVRKNIPESEGMQLVSYWAQMDPFGDVDLGEPDYVLARSHPLTEGRDSGRARIEDVLDIAVLQPKRAQFGLRRVPRLGLNIHHPQDFILLRPLLEVLPRQDIVALVRKGFLQPDELALVRGTFERCGIETCFYERCIEIPWQALALRHLISPAESNVATNHILSRQVVEAAKLNGVHTVHLQHGVWVEPFAERMISFGSDTIFSWGRGYERFVCELGVSLAGSNPRPPLPNNGQTFHAIGGPKLVDLQLMPPKELLRWRLGLKLDRFRAVALLGTNLRWQHHAHATEDVYALLASMMQATPDVFFIIKVHPSERASEAASLRRPNSFILDDILLGVMDVGINRLVAAVDVVISSLSTLLLDGVIAGKPVIQYDTGNALGYEGIRPVPLEQVPQLLQHLSDLPLLTQLATTYAEAATEPFYGHFAAELQAPREPHSAEALNAAASFYSVANDVEHLWYSTASLRAELAKASVNSLALQTQIEQAGGRAELLQMQLDERSALVAMLQANRDTSDAAVEQSRAQLSSQAEQLARLTADLAQANEARADVSRMVEAAREREEAAQASAKNAWATLNAAQSTLSWRITAPLRWARRRFKR